ncbi:hypothetical protein H8E88_23440 [candidate division KSB1 bacterium]|nr:hypothetical protein [candidate division KSB1 bacterium]
MLIVDHASCWTSFTINYWQNDYGQNNLIDEIIRLNLADIRLYLKQVKEYTSVTNRNKKNIQH